MVKKMDRAREKKEHTSAWACFVALSHGVFVAHKSINTQLWALWTLRFPSSGSVHPQTNKQKNQQTVKNSATTRRSVYYVYLKAQPGKASCKPFAVQNLPNVLFIKLCLFWAFFTYTLKGTISSRHLGRRQNIPRTSDGFLLNLFY